METCDIGYSIIVLLSVTISHKDEEVLAMQEKLVVYMAVRSHVLEEVLSRESNVLL
jgi:hypothetical protein